MVPTPRGLSDGQALVVMHYEDVLGPSGDRDSSQRPSNARSVWPDQMTLKTAIRAPVRPGGEARCSPQVHMAISVRRRAYGLLRLSREPTPSRSRIALARLLRAGGHADEDSARKFA